LLHCEVVDEAGRSLGKVDDVCLAPDGPKLGDFGPALRIEGLAVGASALGVRLGFHRKSMRGPWPLKMLFGRVERRAGYVAWDQVISADDGRVVISGEMSPIPEA
jgi:hypothetical protein